MNTNKRNEKYATIDPNADAYAAVMLYCAALCSGIEHHRIFECFCFYSVTSKRYNVKWMHRKTDATEIQYFCRIKNEKVNKNSEWLIKWKHNGTESILMWLRNMKDSGFMPYHAIPYHVHFILQKATFVVLKRKINFKQKSESKPTSKEEKLWNNRKIM